MTIPAGVPHWFCSIDGSIKVRVDPEKLPETK